MNQGREATMGEGLSKDSMGSGGGAVRQKWLFIK